jgi:uridylate kinase
VRIAVDWATLKAVVKLGGFAFSPDLSHDTIRKYCRVMNSFSKKNQLTVVTGGGVLARKYIAAARELGASESVCDQIGIQASRLNARLFVAGLSDRAYPDIPESLAEFAKFRTSGLIVMMGGLQPGQSTNAVAALAAETMRADCLVNATDVDGVYSSDPEKDAHAKKLDEVTIDELMRILSTQGMGAGEYALMDPLALRIIKRARIPTVIFDGRDPSNLEKAFAGKRVGTRVTPTK